MLGYAIKRLLLAALITVVAVTLLFIIIHSVPGDPASVMLGPRATPELKVRWRPRWASTSRSRSRS